MVLMVAGLFCAALQDTRDIDPGFRREGLLLAAYDMSGRNADDAAGRQFASRLLDRLRALPGVEAAAVASSVPLDIHGLPMRAFTLEGRTRTDRAPDRSRSNLVTPGYFQAMGIPLVAGRDFAAMRNRAAPRQVLVNEAFVQTFVADGEAIGRRLWNNDREYVIAGIVRTSVNDSFNEGPTPCLYFLYRDRPSIAGEMHLATRSGAEAALAEDVRRLVRELNPSLPVYNMRTMAITSTPACSCARCRRGCSPCSARCCWCWPPSGFSGRRLCGLASHHRVGVRLALGATQAGVIRQVVSDTLRVITAGAVAGWLRVHRLHPPRAWSAGEPGRVRRRAGAAAGGRRRGQLVAGARVAGIDPAIALKHL